MAEIYSNIVRLYFLYVLLSISFAQNATLANLSAHNGVNNINTLNCRKGNLLSTFVCLPKGYLKGEAPAPKTKVHSFIEINNIREVNDKEMRITLDFYLDMRWIDDRLKTKFPSGTTVSVLNNHLVSNVWKPDLWIKNLYAFEIHSVLEPTGGLTIREKSCESKTCAKGGKDKNTLIQYNFEALATVYCNFNFLNYPMDIQQCEFQLDGAYPEPGVVHFELKGGQFGFNNNNTNTDKFEIEVLFQKGEAGIHSIITMKRCLLPFIIKYYLPCIAIIIVSLISFLISIDSLPARVALLVTQFLTLTNILIAQQVRMLKVLFISL